jgi:hypothetical protein
MIDVLDLFPQWIIPEPNTGCWLCFGANNQRGYGQLVLGGGRRVTAHRYSYEISIGPIPEGLELDHLCRQPCCVNPAHLEPVTPQENLRRENAARERERGYLCPNGHLRSADNIYTRPNGTRMCRKCIRAAKSRNNPPQPVPFRRISEDVARQIKSAQGSHREVARHFGVRYGTVQAIRSGLSWRHV